MSKAHGFRCFEGHDHLTSAYAKECDERHWKARAAEFGLSPNDKLEKYPAAPRGEQLEAFPEAIRDKR